MIKTDISPHQQIRVPAGITAWTQAEYDILQTMAIRVRVLTFEQAERIWHDSFPSRRQLRSCLADLVESQLLEAYIIHAHPLLTPEAPIASWAPFTPEPKWDDVSKRAKERWRLPGTPVETFVASKRVASLFGGGSSGIPPLEHRDHDLLLTDVYATYREKYRSDVARWIGEDFFPKAGYRTKDPDAFLVDDRGMPLKVIESAGRYSVKQIERFHDHCVTLQLPYELW